MAMPLQVNLAMVTRGKSGLPERVTGTRLRGITFAVVLTIVTVALAACGDADPSPPAPIPPTPAPPAATAPFAATAQLFQSVAPPLPKSSSGTVDVDGHAIWYSCAGEDGVGHTIIFDANFGTQGRSWSPVQFIMPSNIRTCVYDRAGVGQSEPGPQPRNSPQIARELHDWLQQAKIDPPYILVGQFFGTLNIRTYASMYPDDVAGMVFVDGINPDWESRVLEYVRPEQQDKFKDFINGNSEGVDVLENDSLVRGTGPFGDMPLAVLSRSKPPSDYKRYYGIDIEREAAIHLEKIWQELQAKLAGLSTQSTQMNLNSNFAMVETQPELIRDTILGIVEKARR